MHKPGGAVTTVTAPLFLYMFIYAYEELAERAERVFGEEQPNGFVELPRKVCG